MNLEFKEEMRFILFIHLLQNYENNHLLTQPLFECYFGNGAAEPQKIAN